MSITTPQSSPATLGQNIPITPSESGSCYDYGGDCTIRAPHARLLYWPVTTTGGNVCGKKGTTIENTPTILGQPNTVVWDNTTLTSPTVYLSVDELGPLSTQWMTHATHTNVVLPINAATIMTVRIQGSYSLNIADLQTSCVDISGTRGCYNEVPAAAYEGMPRCFVEDGLPSACSTISPNYDPYILLPSEALAYDQAWGPCCRPFNGGTWDPPHALQQAPVAAAPMHTTTMLTTQKTVSPASGPTDPAAPKTVPLDPPIAPDPTAPATRTKVPGNSDSHTFRPTVPDLGNSVKPNTKPPHPDPDPPDVAGDQARGEGVISLTDPGANKHAGNDPSIRFAGLASYIASGLGIPHNLQLGTDVHGQAFANPGVGQDHRAEAIMSVVLSGAPDAQNNKEQAQVAPASLNHYVPGDTGTGSGGSRTVRNDWVTNDPIAYVNGEAILADPSNANIVIGGLTYAPGQQATIGDTRVSVGLGNVVVGSSTFTIPQSNAMITPPAIPARTAVFTAVGNVYTAIDLSHGGDDLTTVKIGSRTFIFSSSDTAAELANGAVIRLRSDGVILGISTIPFLASDATPQDKAVSMAIFPLGNALATALFDPASSSEVVVEEGGTSFTIPQGSTTVVGGETLSWSPSDILVAQSNEIRSTFSWRTGLPTREATEATFSLDSASTTTTGSGYASATQIGSGPPSATLEALSTASASPTTSTANAISENNFLSWAGVILIVDMLLALL